MEEKGKVPGRFSNNFIVLFLELHLVDFVSSSKRNLPTVDRKEFPIVKKIRRNV